MRILHLITGLDRGGAETMLVKLVQRMDRSRFTSIVVSLTDEGRLGAELRGAGIAVSTLGMRRGYPSPAALLRLRALLRREPPDVLQTWLYHADLVGLAAHVMVQRMPLVWNLRCSNMELGAYSRQVRAVRRILAWCSGIPAAVLVNSAAGRRAHAALGYHPRRWELVPNGFDTARFHPDATARAAWRERLGIDAEQPLIGMVARVDPMKDHATFLAAAAAIATARPDAAFLLAGQGTDRLALPPPLVGRLHALGDRAEIADILPALDLHLLSSAFGEGFPNVIGEAMASGVPCIATDVGDAGLIIGETGMVTPPRDPAALAAAAVQLLARSAAERQEGGAAARRRIIAQYGIDAVVERYQEIYASLSRR